MRNQARVVQRWVPSISLGLVLTVAACTAGDQRQPASIEKPRASATLFNTAWQIEDLDRGGVIDRSEITMEILSEGRVSGSTGCNQYFGAVSFGASAFEVEDVGSTRRACVPALMKQEQRFLSALNDVRRYEFDGTFVRLYDDSDTERLRMIRASE